MSDIFIVVFDLLLQSISLIPLIAFQSTAIVGMLAAVLVMTRRPGQPAHWQSLHMGVMLGLVGYTTSWFVADYMVGSVKLNLMLDVLLLGGWLGGLRGGCICYGLLMAARWQFGGEENLVGSMVDAAMPILGGWACRHVWSPQGRTHFPIRLASLLWLVRQVCAGLGLCLGLWLVDEPAETFHGLIVLRLLAAPFSLLILHAVVLLFDRDARIDAQQAREYELTHRDLLSGLPNRRALSEWIRSFWREQPLESACLAVFELANLRDFLLRYGYDRGGQLWQLVADAGSVRQLAASLSPWRPSFFQYGDFSLALCLQGVTLGALERSRVVDQFLGQLAASMAGRWPGFSPTLRCAVVDLGEEVSRLGKPIPYRNITLALSSLDAGVAYFNGIFKRDRQLDSYIEACLSAWSGGSEVPVYLQPKLRLRDRRVVGAEALLRMSDPQGQMISAMRAITVFQRLGRIAEFEWVTLKAVVGLLGAHGSRLQGLSFAANISAASLQQPDFAQRVQALLRERSVAPAALKLEVVEWSEVINHPDVKRNLDQLTEQGIALSIDDFGAGYSNLMLLTQFPFAEVKIDHSLISSIANPRSLSVVKVIIEMAQRCRAVVVAEGIETPQIEARLRALGAEVGQGYLYARAIPIEEFLVFRPEGDRPDA